MSGSISVNTCGATYPADSFRIRHALQGATTACQGKSEEAREGVLLMLTFREPTFLLPLSPGGGPALRWLISTLSVCCRMRGTVDGQPPAEAACIVSQLAVQSLSGHDILRPDERKLRLISATDTGMTGIQRRQQQTVASQRFWYIGRWVRSNLATYLCSEQAYLMAPSACDHCERLHTS